MFVTHWLILDNQKSGLYIIEISYFYSKYLND